MIHLEQVRQPLAILLPLLQIINQPDLPLHQRLRPPRLNRYRHTSSSVIPDAAPGTFVSTTRTRDVVTLLKLTWFGTSRTRLGVLWSPNVLLYGTAGIAYGQVKDTATFTAPGASVTGTFKDVKAGWTAGAGIEGAFGGGWSAKLEYLYMDLGKTERTFSGVGFGTIATETRRTTDNLVRVGLNYRWGAGY